MRARSAIGLLLLASTSGCSAILPFEDLSGGKSTEDPECSWRLSAETRFEASGRTAALDVGDFDLDGVPDVVVAANDRFADTDFCSIQTHLYRGDRSFEDWYNATKNSAPGGSMFTRGVATGDLDGDGITDVVQTFGDFEDSDGSFDLNRGLGDGRLEWDGIWTLPNPDDAALGDFDGDGFLDAAVNSRTLSGVADEKLFFSWGDGQGSFELPIEYVPSGVFTNTINELHATDLDADGRSDLVVLSWGYGTLFVLRGTADRGMHLLDEIPVGSAPTGVADADFDRDGKLDLAVVNSNDFSVSLLFGTGDGRFERETPLTVGKSIKRIVAVDLDRDQDVDLAVGADGELFTLSNDGSGNFAEPVSHAMDGSPGRFAAADFEGDGYPDLAVSNYNRNSFSVFWGECVVEADTAPGP